MCISRSEYYALQHLQCGCKKAMEIACIFDAFSMHIQNVFLHSLVMHFSYVPYMQKKCASHLHHRSCFLSTSVDVISMHSACSMYAFYKHITSASLMQLQCTSVNVISMHFVCSTYAFYKHITSASLMQLQCTSVDVIYMHSVCSAYAFYKHIISASTMQLGCTFVYLLFMHYVCRL